MMHDWATAWRPISRRRLSFYLKAGRAGLSRPAQFNVGNMYANGYA